MRIFKLLAVLLLLCPACFAADRYKYAKGGVEYEIRDEGKVYRVLCRREGSGSLPRNRNIIDRKLRLEAADLLGAYVLFTTKTELPAELFPVYVEGVNFHYAAEAANLRHEEVEADGESCLSFACDKEDFSMGNATYNASVEAAALLLANYDRRKDERSAALLYDSDAFSSELYVTMQADFAGGKAQLPKGVRLLQGIPGRFDNSLSAEGDSAQSEALGRVRKSVPKNQPWLRFYCEELLTSAPAKEKPAIYKKWLRSFAGARCAWEDFTAFCAYKSQDGKPAGNSYCGSIAAYCGAMSPSGMSVPSTDASYKAAASAYAKSRFDESLRLLTEAIDNEGISGPLLNLTGASYRFLGEPAKALPYLLLGFKLDPETPYLAGNIALCAKALDYERLGELAAFLKKYAKDSWSIKTLNDL